MRRCIADDTPAYAAEAIASARFSSHRLVASGGLFIALLIAMSLIEAPQSRAGGNEHLTADELNTISVGSPPAHLDAGIPVAQIDYGNSGRSQAADNPSCVPSWASDRHS
jgi:hypothetical protein